MKTQPARNRFIVEEDGGKLQPIKSIPYIHTKSVLPPMKHRNINSDAILKASQGSDMDFFSTVHTSRFMKPIGHFSGKDMVSNVLTNPYFGTRNRSMAASSDIANQTQIFGLRHKSINYKLDPMAH